MLSRYLIVIIVGLVIICALLFAALRKVERLNNNNKSVIAEMNDSLRHSRTETGRERAEKLAAQATAKQFETAYPLLADRISRELDIKLKRLQVVIENKFTAHGTGESKVVNNVYGPDGYVRKEASFGDAYFKANLVFIDTTRFSWTYSYSDTITTAVHSKRKWFLGKERLYATSLLQNKNASITGATSVLIDSYRDKRFVIYIGLGYDPFNNRPVVNAGLGYALFKF